MSTVFVYLPDGKTKGYTGVESLFKVEDGVVIFYSQPDSSKNTRKKVQTSQPSPVRAKRTGGLGFA
jgi:hypothetical protein